MVLRLNLRIIGIPILEETRELCDNKSKVNSSSLLESTLHSTYSSIAYYSIRWEVAVQTMLVGWIGTSLNISDTLKKRLGAMNRDKLFGYWTYEHQ